MENFLIEMKGEREAYAISEGENISPHSAAAKYGEQKNIVEQKQKGLYLPE